MPDERQPRGLVHQVGIDSRSSSRGTSGTVCKRKDRWTTKVTPEPGDMAAQLELALDNLEAVLAAAGMTLANIVRLNVYTTDLDEYLKHFARVNNRFGNSRYATTVLGVAQLPAQLLVMLEATAVD